MKKTMILLMTAAFALAGCQSSSNAQTSSSSSAESQASSVQASQDSESAARPKNEPKTGKGERVSVNLKRAVEKKNADEQFLLLYTKDDCSYCAEFDEVLNPYLENHPLQIFEVSLTEAEKEYSDADREAMLNILSAGVEKTPALYFIESQVTVNLLDHSQDNYSADGLEQWVEKYDLTNLAHTEQ